MSAPGCERWRDAIALDALGALPADERAGLLAHLDGCAPCRDLARELEETATALGAVDREDVVAAASVPPHLTERVLGTIHDNARESRRRRVVRSSMAAVGAVAASIALVLVLVLGGQSTGSGTRTIVLSPQASSAAATATAVLSSRTWGTAIDFSEHGLPAGAVYEVYMRTGDGSWWATGSYTGAGVHQVVAQMACAVPMRSITGIRVNTTSGTTVLESVAAPGTTW